MQSIKSNLERNTIAKNLCTLNPRNKIDIDHVFDLEVKGFYIKQVFLDFGHKQT